MKSGYLLHAKFLSGSRDTVIETIIEGQYYSGLDYCNNTIYYINVF